MKSRTNAEQTKTPGRAPPPHVKHFPLLWPITDHFGLGCIIRFPLSAVNKGAQLRRVGLSRRHGDVCTVIRHEGVSRVWDP